MKIHSFDPVEWWRALRPYLCECGHMRSLHTHGRGHCGRCTCARPVKASRWSMLSIGYRLGYEAGRMTSGSSTVTVVAHEPGPFDGHAYPAHELETHWPTGHAVDPLTVALDVHPADCSCTWGDEPSCTCTSPT